ncbi:hypothetical protein AC578_4666 [Pseudocercospora eumusae]|uniref:BTB domain-containing protein n=1 Tax=Pseudocercospora eumusae TaxID=321146 RepID=A0A139H7C5_9PEZI|nr:hypothetical protein AC578_4666 [Pseudocercospora eumusae]
MAEKDDPLVEKSGSFIDGDVVAVTGRRKCFVHKSLLERRAANIKEYQTTNPTRYDVSRMPQSRALPLYIHYLYTGEIQCKEDSLGADFKKQDEALFDFYVLAEKLGDSIATHAAMRALMKDHEAHRNTGRPIPWPDSDLVKRVYNETGKNSPWCRMWVDLYIWSAEPDEDYGDFDLPHEFVKDLLKAAFARWSRGESHLKGADTATCCDYHQLEDGQVCGSKKRKRSSTEE